MPCHTSTHFALLPSALTPPPLLPSPWTARPQAASELATGPVHAGSSPVSPLSPEVPLGSGVNKQSPFSGPISRRGCGRCSDWPSSPSSCALASPLGMNLYPHLEETEGQGGKGTHLPHMYTLDPHLPSGGCLSVEQGHSMENLALSSRRF